MWGFAVFWFWGSHLLFASNQVFEGSELAMLIVHGIVAQIKRTASVLGV